MSAVLDQKKQVVEEIRSKIKDAKSIVLVDYRGLTVEEVTELRKKYTQAGVDYKVYKNTMMRFAFKEEGYEAFNEFLVGPNAIAISKDDVVAPARIANDFVKEHKNLEFKAGIVEGEIVGVDKIKAIGELPSKEVLLTQLVIALNSPISKFARTIQAIVDKEPQEA
ncbi:50S ribosomal protein L10 [Proteiniborus sp. MB09-C3]|uniref:50S ribosomal protein L10 n=1 Tax=Proteiniborus sp. MB09-C3 TaxID=3050072 RepID=UPI0025535DF1|nr:50S ribosomal protein L10 [Proteiniborus sp. MB09-C3]WIV13142.1 50S ribosomal protein L10 [Proteiniborus sp. MB09-C3]